jgi:hypothetical protein
MVNAGREGGETQDSRVEGNWRGDEQEVEEIYEGTEVGSSKLPGSNR